MAPKKTTDSSEPAEAPRRSSRVAAQPPPSKKEEPVAPAKKPASTKAKAPASKAADKKTADKPESTKAPAKAPASKKRAAEDAPAKAPASKKTKEDDSAKPKSTKAATKPASTKAAAEKPASKKPASTKAAASSADKPASKAADKPASKAAASAKPASKKPASKAADKPKSTAKPKSKKVDTIAEEGDVDMETDGKTEAEKKEVEAAHEGSDADQSGAMKEGETLPKITLKDNKGEDVDVSSLATADHGVIFFTYPKANTPGCTSQACQFRDSYPDFESAGYKVYGLSTDSPAQQESWNAEKKFGYPLLSDPKSELLKKLGAFAPPKNTVRSHFIFEKGTGKLLEAKTKVKPADDAKNCLAFIKKHHSS